MKIRLASKIQVDSIVDGEGIRAVIWTQGCPHNCYGCHNPNTHDYCGGYETSTEEVNEQLDKLQIQDGITISGGDPFFQKVPCTIIAKHAKEIGLNVWCYTGYTFEELLKDDEAKEFLKYIDVLVDGKFVLSEKSLNLKFRGSKNQRIIDVKKSLKTKKPCIVAKYNERNKTSCVRKEPLKSYIFI